MSDIITRKFFVLMLLHGIIIYLGVFAYLFIEAKIPMADGVKALLIFAGIVFVLFGWPISRAISSRLIH